MVLLNWWWTTCLMSARWLDDDEDDLDDEPAPSASRCRRRRRRALEYGSASLFAEDSTAATAARETHPSQDEKDTTTSNNDNEQERQKLQLRLSPVGRAVYQCLYKHHRQHGAGGGGVLWNVSSGSVVGNFQSTPRGVFEEKTTSTTATTATAAAASGSSSEDNDDDDECEYHDPLNGHDDWFARALSDLVASTEQFVDVLSLREPDGLFLQEFRRAITILASKQQNQNQQQQRPIVIRLMFGNVFAWPVDCQRVVQDLTRDITKSMHHSPDSENNNNNTSNIQLWVGAWRRNFSWNHAKIIAVDGQQLHTGGHNLWSQHYLDVHPLHDVSVQLQGPVALDGHAFANRQWQFLIHELQQQQQQQQNWNLAAVPFQTHCTLASFPSSSASSNASSHNNNNMSRFPPMFSVTASIPTRLREEMSPSLQQQQHMESSNNNKSTNNHVPILTLGKMGCILNSPDRPSDDALVALLNAAQHSICIATQDLGPRCIPSPPIVPLSSSWPQIPYPGTGWPRATLQALARALYARHVQVDIVLANVGAVCGGLPASDTLARPNGWTVAQLYQQVIATVQDEFGLRHNDVAQRVVRHKLRVCGLRQATGRNCYRDGTKLGLHSKCYIVDRSTFYIGSQNLYVCDLAEWGVLVDDRSTTQQLLDEYWDPMWACSWRSE